MSNLSGEHLTVEQKHTQTKMSIRKQNAISFTLTPDIDSTDHTSTERSETATSRGSLVRTRSFATSDLPGLNPSITSTSNTSSSSKTYQLTTTPLSLPGVDETSVISSSDNSSKLNALGPVSSSSQSYPDNKHMTSNQKFDQPSSEVGIGSNFNTSTIRPKIGSRNIPNVLLTKLSSIDDRETNEYTYNDVSDHPISEAHLRHVISKVQLSVNPNISQNLSTRQADPLSVRGGCKSASSSPKNKRRSRGFVLPEQLYPTSAVIGGGGSLNVPSYTMTRKLSLQPHSERIAIGQGAALSAASSNLHISSQQNLAKSSGSISNLSVHNSQHFIHRRSIMGQLERPSMQTQRLSDVGVAFGQQITARMGFKLPASQDRIVEQTRWLYLRYIFVKLRQNSLPLRDLNLTKSSRARRAAALGIAGTNSPATTTLQARELVSGPLSRSLRRPDGRKSTLIGEGFDQQTLSYLTARSKGNENTNAQTAAWEDDSSIGSKNPLLSTTQTTILSAPNTTNTTTITTTTATRRYIMDPTINNQIFSVIMNIVKELRELKPDLYGDTIYELIGIDKFASLESLLDVQLTICREMTRSEISWCRITALFSLFGAMSLDCVRLGAPEHVGPILDAFIGFVERDLALWISQQGGWELFLHKYRAGYSLGPLAAKVVATVAVPLVAWALVSVFR